MDDSSIIFHGKVFLHFLRKFGKKWRKTLTWKTDESSIKKPYVSESEPGEFGHSMKSFFLDYVMVLHLLSRISLWDCRNPISVSESEQLENWWRIVELIENRQIDESDKRGVRLLYVRFCVQSVKVGGIFYMTSLLGFAEV